MEYNNNYKISYYPLFFGNILEESEDDYYNNIILYSAEKNKVLSLYYTVKIIKINNNKYIGLDKNKNLIEIEIKIDLDKNVYNLEISQCF